MNSTDYIVKESGLFHLVKDVKDFRRKLDVRVMQTQPLISVIVGCESGNNRRPCKIQWVENIVDQVRRGRSDNDPNRTRIFIKQVNINGKVVKDWNDPLFPEHLKIREFPNEN
jgi:hypothetical protein